MKIVTSFAREVQNALNTEDGGSLASLFTLQTTGASLLTSIRNVDPSTFESHNGLKSILKQTPRWRDITVSYLECVVSNGGTTMEDAKAAFLAQRDILKDFIEELKTSTGTWLLDVMYVFVRQLRGLAKEADILSSSGVISTKFRSDSVEPLMNLFSVTCNDRSPDLRRSKKMGTLYVVNNLCKIYFLTNNVQRSLNLFKPIDRKEWPPLRLFPISHVTTFKYYFGRYFLYAGNFEKAEEALQFAFERCAKSHKHNKQLVLWFLVPVKMLRGHYPPRDVLSRYHLAEYIDLVQAVHRGDVASFNKTMEKNEGIFIRRGVFLILEKLRFLLYRNLLKQIAKFEGGTKINLGLVRGALEWGGEDVDLDETECIVANLIACGLVKGYVSHKHRTLVIAKNQAFASGVKAL
mmetsp:Transcript_11686/g.32838  ORF Transcript_11686/g.32838 Transcript_11686/m.32838 type:complete len:407 (+) Transcript_11686:1356-2576(+)